MSNRFERAADKKLNEKHQKILKDLLSNPENKICADCKKRDPRWASANLGIFICLRCSGIHRSMGVHISKVRSVDLDMWTPEHIEIMQRWGNARANKYWEYGLPAGHVPEDERMVAFIRSKYEAKKFTKPGPMPEPELLDSATTQRPVNSQLPVAQIQQLPPQLPARTPIVNNDLLGDFFNVTSTAAPVTVAPVRTQDVWSDFATLAPPASNVAPARNAHDEWSDFSSFSAPTSSHGAWSNFNGPPQFQQPIQGKQGQQMPPQMQQQHQTQQQFSTFRNNYNMYQLVSSLKLSKNKIKFMQVTTAQKSPSSPSLSLLSQQQMDPERIYAWLEAIGILNNNLEGGIPNTLSLSDTKKSLILPSAVVDKQPKKQDNENIMNRLHHALKDGVSLCKLLNFVKPEAINKINLNTDHPFSAMDNINRFLSSCEYHFAISSDIKLFEVKDLYHNENMGKVLEVLSYIAQKAKALGLKPTVDEVIINRPKQSQSDEIMENIRATIIESRMVALFDYDATKSDELTFKEGDLIFVMNKVDGGWWEGQHILTKKTGWFPCNYVTLKPEISSAIKETKSAKNSSVLDEEEANFILLRGMFLRDVIKSEQTFFDSLTAFAQHVVEYLAMPEMQKLMPVTDHVIAFGRLFDVLEYQHKFLADLNSCLRKSFKDQILANVFRENLSDFVSVYSQYCEQYSKAVRVVSKYKNDVKFAETLRAAYQAVPTSPHLIFVNPPILNIMTWLVKPSQRLPVYLTLVKELLKSTPKNHADHTLLPQVEKEMSNALAEINKIKKDAENREIIADLGGRIENWDGPALEHFGELIIDGMLKVVKQDKARERYFFLLEKIFICLHKTDAKNENAKYMLLERIPVNKSIMQVSNLPDNEFAKNAFHVVIKSEDNKFRTLTLSASTADSKNSWMHHLQSALINSTHFSLPSLPKELQFAIHSIDTEDEERSKPSSLKRFFTKRLKLPKRNPLGPVVESLSKASSLTNLDEKKLATSQPELNLASSVDVIPKSSVTKLDAKVDPTNGLVQRSKSLRFAISKKLGGNDSDSTRSLSKSKHSMNPVQEASPPETALSAILGNQKLLGSPPISRIPLKAQNLLFEKPPISTVANSSSSGSDATRHQEAIPVPPARSKTRPERLESFSSQSSPIVIPPPRRVSKGRFNMVTTTKIESVVSEHSNALSLQNFLNDHQKKHVPSVAPSAATIVNSASQNSIATLGDPQIGSLDSLQPMISLSEIISRMKHDLGSEVDLGNLDLMKTMDLKDVQRLLIFTLGQHYLDLDKITSLEKEIKLLKTNLKLENENP